MIIVLSWPGSSDTKSTAQTTLSFGMSLASQLDPQLASSVQSQTVKWS
jgi:hypothetical protein